MRVTSRHGEKKHDPDELGPDWVFLCPDKLLLTKAHAYVLRYRVDF